MLKRSQAEGLLPFDLKDVNNYFHDHTNAFVKTSVGDLEAKIRDSQAEIARGLETMGGPT
jgi:hypothetical protein